MKVSVVIPVYNEQKVIIDCLESISKQSYRDFEVIVVDDGSTDNSLKNISELRIKNYELRVLKQKHLGAGSARNFGAERSKGEILVFVDGDMTFDRDFIEMLIRPIVKEGAIGTFSKEEFLANKDNVWAICWNLNRGLPKQKMHPDDYPDRQKVFRAILKSKFIEAGGFNPRAGYTDDWSLSERLDEKAISAKNAVFYHKNPESLAEVFIQSKWMAKRKYKLGFLGYLIAIARVALPFSVIIGVYKSIRISNFKFFIFKLVYDFGQFVGIFEYLLIGKVSK